MQYSLLTLAIAILTRAQKQAPICEDSIDSQPPFNNNVIPCLLGCPAALTMATGGLLPGSINATDTPYCRLRCVRPDFTPAEFAAAPACNERCERTNSATPDQMGWCMYWCVEGGEIESMVVSTTCVPSLQRTPVSTLTIGTEHPNGGEESFVLFTELGFTVPTQWASWYQTQTVISRKSELAFGPRTTSTMAPTATAGSVYELTYSSTISLDATTCGDDTWWQCTDSDTHSTAGKTSLPGADLSMTTTTPVTGDAQAQSVETESASTTTAGSGSPETHRPYWTFLALFAGALAFA